MESAMKTWMIFPYLFPCKCKFSWDFLHYSPSIGIYRYMLLYSHYICAIFPFNPIHHSFAIKSPFNPMETLMSPHQNPNKFPMKSHQITIKSHEPPLNSNSTFHQSSHEIIILKPFEHHSITILL